jgi:hypothetical protein
VARESNSLYQGAFFKSKCCIGGKAESINSGKRGDSKKCVLVIGGIAVF